MLKLVHTMVVLEGTIKPLPVPPLQTGLAVHAQLVAAISTYQHSVVGEQIQGVLIVVLVLDQITGLLHVVGALLVNVLLVLLVVLEITGLLYVVGALLVNVILVLLVVLEITGLLYVVGALLECVNVAQLAITV